MKFKAKLVNFLINCGIFAEAFFINVFLINLIFNYSYKLINAFAYSIKHKMSNRQDLTFHIYYLFNTPQGLNIKVVFAFAALITIVFARGIVLKIGRYFFTKLPLAVQDVEGSQRWATKGEIKKYLKPVCKKCGVAGNKQLPGIFKRVIEFLIAHAEDNAVNGYNYAGAVLAEDKKHLYVENENKHMLIIGATGSGKSQLEALPKIYIISRCKSPESFVSNDLKGEQLESTYSILIENGYYVCVLDFDEPARSARWNPLTPIIKAYVEVADKKGDDFSKAQALANELAKMITDDPQSSPVWPTSAKSLLVSMIFYLIEDGYKRGQLDKVNMYSVYNFFIEFGSKNIIKGKQHYNALDLIMSALPVGHPAKMAYAASKFAQGEMRSSIFGVLSTNLDIFASSGTAYLTGANEINFEKLCSPDKPCAVFVVKSENNTAMDKLASLFFSQCYSALVDIARRNPERALTRRVHFILDEFGNMPQIPEMQSKITASRSLNINFNLYIQDFSQLESIYGKSAAKTIINNCTDKVYINTTDYDTNKYFSDMLGNETVEYNTYSSDSGEILDKSRTSHYKARPLKTPDELAHLGNNEVIAIKQRCYPIISEITPFYKYDISHKNIHDILTEKQINVSDILYPILQIPVPGIPKDDAAKAEKSDNEIAAEAKKRDLKINGIINNVNILTHMEFSSAMNNGDLKAMENIHDKLLDEDKITEEQAELLSDVIHGK